MANIEQLKKETDEITKSLKELKDNVSLSEADKKDKAEELKTQVDKTKKKIQKEVDILATKTDNESKKKKEEMEALLVSFLETVGLYASILGSQESNESGKQSEAKGVFAKAKDWIGEQWRDIWDKNKWEEEKGKNLLRATGFALSIVGTGALIYKGLKKLFGKDEETPDGDTEGEVDADGVEVEGDGDEE